MEKSPLTKISREDGSTRSWSLADIEVLETFVIRVIRDLCAHCQ